MKIKVRNRCSDFDTYRAARVKSMFNAEGGCDFSLDAELPIDGRDWCLGLVVGPSGSGKTSIGHQVFGGAGCQEKPWPMDRPIVDAIAPDADFNQVTAALAGVGLGSVPAWLRPYGVLSNGERFRADLARVICEAPHRVVIDEFSSVVDRQIAKIGALAFAKSWRRVAREKGSQCVLLACHYDIIEWLRPDWVYDTATNQFHGRWLQPRPRIVLAVQETDWSYWPLFEPHHYLKMPPMVASRCYVGTVNGQPVCHVGISGMHTGLGMEVRMARLVVMPEWQGAGIGLRFINYLASRQLDGRGAFPGRQLTTMIHTTHPGLARALRHDPQWRQITSMLYGGNRRKAVESLRRSEKRNNSKVKSTGYGGHFRAVQGFRYYGKEGIKAAKKDGLAA